jgi:hypothetical protein
MMTEPILAPTFLFRFAVPCQYLAKPWSTRDIELPQKYRMPSFGQLEQRPMFADVRLGWSEEGLGVSVRVQGKKQSPWCRSSRFEDSDGLFLWIDSRDTHNIHRASRFCHRFALLPQGSGPQREKPTAGLLPIPRARQDPKPVDPEVIKIRSEKRVDGYLLRAHLPAGAMTGFDPQEQPRLGFSYAVTDRELGWQTFSVGSEFAFQSDPTLWGTLDLVRD